MVDSAANILLGTLRDLLIDEVKFVSGVEDEVNKVESDLRSIHALLMEIDTNRSRFESPALNNCMAELKELASRAENVLETYTFEVQSKRQGKGLKKNFKRFMGILGEWCSLHDVGNEIGDIRSRLAHLTTELRSIPGGGEGSSYSADQEQRRQLRLRYAHEVDHHFVGMKEDIHSLVSIVKDDSTHTPAVITICGMGGLGKTTLARKIYNHPDIQKYFRCRAWVCVTQQFQADTILREIIQQINGNKPPEDQTYDGLVRGLYNILEKKKCLIVIDDIWEANHWNILKAAFPKKNYKVLLTTRNVNITSHECHLHKLRFLTEDEGWELLQKIAFPINDDEAQRPFSYGLKSVWEMLQKIAFPMNGDETQVFQSSLKPFEHIGRQMVQKCGFLPLAISVIGGILHQKRQILVEWEEVSRNMDSYLKNGGEGIKSDKRVKQILDLSFDVLPYYLKPCFLYLACFPQDSEIHTEELYGLWMAEGLISPEEKGNHESLRDVAERYLNELAFRCMVQVKSHKFNIPHNKFESCRLHDLMHDLCSSKAEEEKFIKRVAISQLHQDIPSSIRPSINRLAIYVMETPTTQRKNFQQEVKDLRSFLVLFRFFGRRVTVLGPRIDIVISESSKNLRILSLEGFQFKGKRMPRRIRKLIHLKYMNLRASNVKKLPQSVCHLPYLQTLDLRVEKLILIPNCIWKMKRLRHLFLPKQIKVVGGGKLKLAGLNELETLEEINSITSHIEDLINLTNLRSLIATIEEDEKCLLTIVDYMSNHGCPLLQTRVTLKSCNLRNVVKKMEKIGSLISLNIRNCDIGVDGMDVLGKFPKLQSLWLGELGEFEAKTELIVDANSFQELKELYLFGLNGLRKWEVENGAMPKLRDLNIFGCKKLEKLPDGVRFISTLQCLDCVGMSKEFKARMRRDGGEDYGNFCHIPQINII